MRLQARPHPKRKGEMGGSGDGGHHQKGPLGECAAGPFGFGDRGGIDPFRPVNVARCGWFLGKKNAPDDAGQFQFTEGTASAKGPSPGST